MNDSGKISFARKAYNSRGKARLQGFARAFQPYQWKLRSRKIQLLQPASHGKWRVRETSALRGGGGGESSKQRRGSSWAASYAVYSHAQHICTAKSLTRNLRQQGTLPWFSYCINASARKWVRGNGVADYLLFTQVGASERALSALGTLLNWFRAASIFLETKIAPAGVSVRNLARVLIRLG